MQTTAVEMAPPSRFVDGNAIVSRVVRGAVPATVRKDESTWRTHMCRPYLPTVPTGPTRGRGFPGVMIDGGRGVACLAAVRSRPSAWAASEGTQEGRPEAEREVVPRRLSPGSRWGELKQPPARPSNQLPGTSGSGSSAHSPGVPGEAPAWLSRWSFCHNQESVTPHSRGGVSRRVCSAVYSAGWLAHRWTSCPSPHLGSHAISTFVRLIRIVAGCAPLGRQPHTGQSCKADESPRRRISAQSSRARLDRRDVSFSLTNPRRFVSKPIENAVRYNLSTVVLFLLEVRRESTTVL